MFTIKQTILKITEKLLIFLLYIQILFPVKNGIISRLRFDFIHHIKEFCFESDNNSSIFVNESRIFLKEFLKCIELQ